MNDILKFLIGIGVIQATLLGIYLFFFPGERKQVSRLIAFMFFLSSLILTSELAELFNLEGILEIRPNIAILFDLLYGPLIWWITLFSLDQKKKFVNRDWIHVLPFILGLIWIHTGFAGFGSNAHGSFSHIPDAIALMVLWKSAILASYCWVTYKEVLQSVNKVSNSLEKSMLPLLKKVYWAFVIIAVISYSAFWMMYFGVSMKVDSDYLSSILMTSFVYYFTFTVLRQPNFIMKSTQGFGREKYAKSSLDDQSLSLYQNKLVNYLQQEKPFLDKKMTLIGLANELNISPNALSQTINAGLKKSFYDLLNEYRIEEVKKKLVDPTEDHKTILALAYESGFQSKASFNRIFKKAVGMTPHSFKNKYRSQPTR